MKTTPNLIFIATSVTIIILTFMAVIYIGHQRTPMPDGLSMDSATQDPPPSPLSVTNTPAGRSRQVSDSFFDSPPEPGSGWPSDADGERASAQDDTEPVVMTDYKNWTIIAARITFRDGYTVGEGKTGITHRDGTFITASAGFISHANQEGQIDLIYIPQAAQIKLPDGQVIVSTDTELLSRADGTYTIDSGRSVIPGGGGYNPVAVAK